MIYFLFHNVYSQEQVQEDARKRAIITSPGMSFFCCFQICRRLHE